MKTVDECITGKNQPFKVGDSVQFYFMSKPVRGLIIEDRGNLGVGKKRLYRIELQTDEPDRELELPYDVLQLVG